MPDREIIFLSEIPTKSKSIYYMNVFVFMDYLLAKHNSEESLGWVRALIHE